MAAAPGRDKRLQPDFGRTPTRVRPPPLIIFVNHRRLEASTIDGYAAFAMLAHANRGHWTRRIEPAKGIRAVFAWPLSGMRCMVNMVSTVFHSIWRKRFSLNDQKTMQTVRTVQAGRPTKHSLAVVENLCRAIADGMPIKGACAVAGRVARESILNPSR